MHNFCTITTASHLFKCFALADSLGEATLHVLVVDDHDSKTSLPPNVILYPLSCIDIPVGKQLIKKYGSNKDKLRWSMKPVFMRQLLVTTDKMIYVDNDIYFFGNSTLLFEQLNHYRVLLTPHFYSSDPHREQNWLEANFRVGLYNAGFFAARRDAADVLDWWARCCLYAIKQSFWRGLFDDQKYLDLVTVIFEGVGVLKHRGCNVAGWNYKTGEITQSLDSQMLSGYPIMFIHFAELTMKEFSKPASPFLEHYTQYIAALKKHKPSFTFRKSRWKAYHFKSYFYYAKWGFLRLFNQ